MESELGELAGSFQQWSEHINNQKKLLESEIDRLKSFQQDHNALEKQLKTLPDKTTRSAMIPIGSLAFMPGKFIHTNEITVYLGSNYYVERSAKQALEILDRRKQVVKDNLKLLEEQLEGLSSKEDAKFGAFPSSDMGVNEEGLPIMEIREELPEEGDQQQQEASTSQPEPAKPVISSETENATSAEKPVATDNKHMKDVMALLEQLDGEDEDEEEYVEQEEKSFRERIMEQAKEEESDEDDTDDDELDDRYDTEIADNLFDHFDDDEEYAIEGVVEQEDATIHEEDNDEASSLVPNVIESTIKETPTVSDASKEKAKEKVVAHQQEQSTEVQAATVASSPTTSEPVSKPKKISRFKAARNQDRIHTPETTNESHQPASTSIEEHQIPAVKPVTSSATAPKKVSKFKAARQQHMEIPSVEAADSNASSSATSRKNQARSIPEVQPSTSNEPSTTPIQKRGIPVVESAGAKKKTSRFKAARQQARENKTTIEPSSSVSPIRNSNTVPSKDENGKRRVTWDEVATVQEHDRSAAPSEATSSDTYKSPVKQESDNATTAVPQVIRSPADIFKVVKAQRQILLDDGYPSLDTGEDNFDEAESTIVTMDELRHSANLGKQELWQLKVEPDNPIFYNNNQMPQEQQQQASLPKMPKSKLDTNIMKGAVLEREIEAVDLEQVEADMDLREVTSSYHKKKYDIVAAMGGYTFEPKDTFEVVDEELPLPSAQGEKKKSQPEPEEKPKKMSRFKAARLAKLDRQEE